MCFPCRLIFYGCTTQFGWHFEMTESSVICYKRASVAQEKWDRLGKRRNMGSLKITKIGLERACMSTCVRGAFCNLSPLKSGDTAVQMCFSVSRTWNTGKGLFDHYLPVSLPSTGTACYEDWCAALTGQKHTCKLKHIKSGKAAYPWVWLLLALRFVPEEA